MDTNNFLFCLSLLSLSLYLFIKKRSIDIFTLSGISAILYSFPLWMPIVLLSIVKICKLYKIESRNLYIFCLTVHFFAFFSGYL